MPGLIIDIWIVVLPSSEKTELNFGTSKKLSDCFAVGLYTLMFWVETCSTRPVQMPGFSASAVWGVAITSISANSHAEAIKKASLRIPESSFSLARTHYTQRRSAQPCSAVSKRLPCREATFHACAHAGKRSAWHCRFRV